MFDRGILRGMSLYLHKVELYLQRGITQQTDQVCLCCDLQRHQVQHHHAQRADILFRSPQRIHHEDVFLLKKFNSG